MEVNLSHRRPSLAFPNQTTFPSHSFFFKRRFSPSKKWRLQIHEESNGQNPSKNLLVHVVKEGENLTSISKQYGVSVNSILEENRSIVDVNLVFQGQQLKIPSSAVEEIQATQKYRLSISHLRETHQRSLKIVNGLLGKKYFAMQITHTLPQVKSTGYFLVLVPLLAFCIRCMIAALQRVAMAGNLQRPAVNESKGHHHKSTRWKYALSDITDADIPDPESTSDSNESSQDQALTSFEDMAHVYNKLEYDYNKFLSECGMSKWGYWRGGSSDE